jgi:hypothetical protein
MAVVNDNMSEGLKKLLRQVADLMVLPDADLQFLTSLQGTITEYIRAQSSALAQAASGNSDPTAQMQAGGMAGLSGGGGDPLAAMMSGMMGGGGGSMGAPPGGGNMGLNPGPVAADDLRRILSSGSRGG